MPEYRYRIMFVDDDEDIVDMIDSYMTSEGYKIIPAYDGESALRIFNQTQQSENSEDRIHLILLDIMMPKIDGFDVCREIRKTSNVPIVMLTAKTEDIDKIIGLELGADDYMVKPFNPRELLARIRSVIRRSYAPNEESPGSSDGVLVYGDFRIDPARRSASIRERDLKLTATEFDLLYFLVKRAGQSVSPAGSSLITFGTPTTASANAPSTSTYADSESMSKRTRPDRITSSPSGALDTSSMTAHHWAGGLR